MDQLIEFLNDQPLLMIAVAITLGVLLGKFQIRGVGLGSSGVLFVAMALGHLGFELPAIVGDLGIVLFVYSVGLQAGPHFLYSIRRSGVSYAILAVATLAMAWLTALVFAQTLGLETSLATGIYAGALTSTPALAASLQSLADPRVSVGFGLAYPLGVICVILFVQFLPRLLRFDWQQEIERAKAADSQPPIEFAWFKVANPQVEDKTVAEIEALHGGDAVISRVFDQHMAMPAHSDVRLSVGQHVRAVGSAEECKRLELVLGPRVADFKEPRSAITSATVVVTGERFCGQTLQQMSFRQRYGVTVTRLWRDEFEFVPTANMSLQFGDEVRIVGDVDDCNRLIALLGHRPDRIHETRFLPLGFGLLAGILIGLVPFPLPGDLSLRLGLAGGPLVAGLVVGHFGGIGRVSFRVPVAARLFMNELGLFLFLTSAGLRAGDSFWEVVSHSGVSMSLAGAAVTVVPLLVAFTMARYWFRWDALHVLGAVCGAMTCTPGLGIVNRLANSSAPATAYVAVYPVALITVSILAPLLGIALASLAQ